LFILVAASHAPQCDCRTHRIHIGHGVILIATNAK
jgi:hypothetical protein